MPWSELPLFWKVLRTTVVDPESPMTAPLLFWNVSSLSVVVPLSTSTAWTPQLWNVLRVTVAVPAPALRPLELLVSRGWPE